ncbi:MAG: hypothetical protein SNF93_03485 [Rikenellaceae bacterium]
MRKLYLSLSRFVVAVAIYGSSLFTSTSCVNADYDLDKEIDLEMNLIGELTLPIGSIKPLTLGEMLDPADVENLELMEDGSYKISLSDYMSVDITKLGGDSGVSIAAIKGGMTETTEFGMAEFETFDIDVEDVNIEVDTQLTQIDVDGSGTSIADKVEIETGLADMELTYMSQSINITSVPEGEDLPDDAAIYIDAEYQNTTIDLSFGDGITCPDLLKSVTRIDLTGSSATITIDASDFAIVFDNLEMTFPSLVITFPEGFVLECDEDTDSADNTITIKDMVVEGEPRKVDFDILEYNLPLANIDKRLESIEGDIVCTIQEEVPLSGTTKGVEEITSDLIIIDIAADITIADMDFSVGVLEVEVEEQGQLSDQADIKVDDMIQSVTSVTLDKDFNTVNISILPITIPSGLNVSGDNIYIYFPCDTYLLLDEDLTIMNGNYILPIPVSSIIGVSGVSGYNRTISIDKILFADGTVVDEMVSFDPGISMSGTTLTLSMGTKIDDESYSTTLSAYNAIAKEMDPDAALVAKVGSTTGLLIDSAEAVITGYSAPIEDNTIDFTQTQTIDEQLVSINNMTFMEGTQVLVELDIDVNLDLSAAGAPTLSFDDYTIKFPNFLKFAPNAEVEIALTEDGYYTVVLNDKFDSTTTAGHCTYSLTLEIEEIDFSDYDETILSDGVLNLKDQVLLSGGVKVSGGEIDSSDLSGSIACSIDYSISEMKISEVYGVVKPDIPVEDQEISLADLAESLEDIELNVVLDNPTISITATNPLQIPLEITSLTLQPSREESTAGFDAMTINKTISIDPADGDTPSVTQIYITAADYNGGDSSVQYVTLENFGEILNGSPDMIAISYEAGVPEWQEGDALHVVEINTDYEFVLDYSLDIPLAFESFDLEYTTTVDDLGGDLEEVLDYISALELTLTIDNELPISLIISQITPLDADGEAITTLDAFIDSKSNTVAALGTSTVELSLADNAAGDLRKLDGLDIKIEATIDQTAAGVALNSEQSLSISLWAKIPNGITVDLNEE